MEAEGRARGPPYPYMLTSSSRRKITLKALLERATDRERERPSESEPGEEERDRESGSGREQSAERAGVERASVSTASVGVTRRCGEEIGEEAPQT